MLRPAATAEPPQALEARALGKRYGPIAAIDGVDLAIPRGQFVALFGPNGAGKSTLLKIFATLVRPTAGSIRIHGEDPRRAERPALMKRLGVLSHETFLYDHLTGLENLVFYARLYGLPDPRGAARAALRTAGLDDRRSDQARIYSRGMQQRLALARALLHAPDILLLDEPFTGLDREAVDRLQDRLRTARRAGVTCVLATHDFATALPVADRVIVLVSGRIAAERPARGLDDASLHALFRITPSDRREPREAAR